MPSHGRDLLRKSAQRYLAPRFGTEIQLGTFLAQVRGLSRSKYCPDRISFPQWICFSDILYLRAILLFFYLFWLDITSSILGSGTVARTYIVHTFKNPFLVVSTPPFWLPSRLLVLRFTAAFPTPSTIPVTGEGAPPSDLGGRDHLPRFWITNRVLRSRLGRHIRSTYGRIRRNGAGDRHQVQSALSHTHKYNTTP